MAQATISYVASHWMLAGWAGKKTWLTAALVAIITNSQNGEGERNVAKHVDY